MIKQCPICGNSFTSDNKTVKYCSKKCALKAHAVQKAQSKTRMQKKRAEQDKGAHLEARKRREATMLLWQEVCKSWKEEKSKDGHSDFFTPYEVKQFKSDFDWKLQQGDYEKRIIELMEASEQEA